VSLNYELRIDTEWEAQQVSDFLSKELSLEWGEESRLLSPGVLIGVFPSKETRRSIM
jgi:hypothetical protein